MSDTFLAPLDAILGSRSKVRLLRVLLPLDRPVSGREAARLAALSHRVIGALDELAALGILRRRETAGQHLYTFNASHALAPALSAMFDAERARASRILTRLARVLSRVGGVESATLFGSTARGEATPGSDLDVLAIVRTGADRVHDALVEAGPDLESELGVRLSPVVLTISQARRQYTAGSDLLTEAVRDGRRIHGKPLRDLLDG